MIQSVINPLNPEKSKVKVTFFQRMSHLLTSPSLFAFQFEILVVLLLDMHRGVFMSIILVIWNLKGWLCWFFLLCYFLVITFLYLFTDIICLFYLYLIHLYAIYVIKFDQIIACTISKSQGPLWNLAWSLEDLH